MEDILLPSKIELIPGESEREATLVVEPCHKGYGTTVGNALRRVLLSSLPGAAVIAVKIKGVQHEFSPLPGAKEDVLEVVLNLKGLRLRCHSEDSVRLTLSAKGEGVVTAADIDPNSDVEIMNPELVIATLTDKKSTLEMDIVVSKGRGYSTTEERIREKSEIGMIAIDALFTPVREVGFRVEPVRVGRVTDYDKLIMTIETDGTVDPNEALDHSVRILLNHFNLILTRGESAGDLPAAPMIEAATAVEAEVEEAEEDKPKKGKKKAAAKKAAKK